MTLPGDVQNSNQRGTLRYRLYTNDETGLINLSLNPAAVQIGDALCVEGYRHFQVWVHAITLPSTLTLRMGAYHPDPGVNIVTFTNMVIGIVNLTAAGQGCTLYFGSLLPPAPSSAGSIFRVGRFIRLAVENSGAALCQGIQVYLEATG